MIIIFTPPPRGPGDPPPPSFRTELAYGAAFLAAFVLIIGGAVLLAGGRFI